MAAGMASRVALDDLRGDETRILAGIVEAIFAERETLRDADVDGFSAILRAACRRQKRAAEPAAGEQQTRGRARAR